MRVLIVVTRLQARDLRRLGALARLSSEVLGQLRTCPGFLAGRLLLDRRGAAWTMTGWADRPSLDAFRTAHAPVAARVDEVASASASTAWTAASLPSWPEVGRRWTAVPRPAAGLRRTVSVADVVPVPALR